MNHPTYAETIISLKDADLQLRDELVKSGELGNGYHPRMADLHNRNAEQLDDIMNAIGYPTIDKVGQEASEAAWLVIQHSIGQPSFMRKCKTLLETAVSGGQAHPKNLAYLTDRIAVFEDRPQLFGTSFDWDEHGKLTPNRYDDLAKVNERRTSIGLNTLEEQTKIIEKQAKMENQSPPEDFDQRNREYDEWRKEVGWIR